jgi:hypothetical protein
MSFEILALTHSVSRRDALTLPTRKTDELQYNVTAEKLGDRPQHGLRYASAAWFRLCLKVQSYLFLYTEEHESAGMPSAVIDAFMQRYGSCAGDIPTEFRDVMTLVFPDGNDMTDYVDIYNFVLEKLSKLHFRNLFNGRPDQATANVAFRNFIEK